jgi:hypothetical protein
MNSWTIYRIFLHVLCVVPVVMDNCQAVILGAEWVWLSEHLNRSAVLDRSDFSFKKKAILQPYPLYSNEDSAQFDDDPAKPRDSLAQFGNDPAKSGNSPAKPALVLVP